MAGEPILRGAHDPPPLLGGDRPGGIIGRLAPLHFDEGEPLAFDRDEVDLADRCLVALGDDAVSFEPEEKRGNRLGEERPLR
jgi:hypothetical protein